VSNGISRTYRASIVNDPPKLADRVMFPNVADVDWFTPYRESWSIVSAPPFTLYVSSPVLVARLSMLTAAVIA
jgi:hypothetical protein